MLVCSHSAGVSTYTDLRLGTTRQERHTTGPHSNYLLAGGVQLDLIFGLVLVPVLRHTRYTVQFRCGISVLKSFVCRCEMPSVSVDMTRSLDYSDFLSSKCCVSDTKQTNKQTNIQTQTQTEAKPMRQTGPAGPVGVVFMCK